MNAEIIAIGNEIVTGNTINTNAAYIAKQIQTIGITPQYHSAACDKAEDIQNVLNEALGRADILFITGGLGPTKDDLTKEVVCSCLGKDLIVRETIAQEIKDYFQKIQRNMPKNNIKQAAFPDDAYVLKNDNGTAPGCILTKNKQYIVLLPGPPKEMKPMLDQYVLPYFKEKLNCFYHTIDIKLFGIGESEMAEKIADLLGIFENATVAPYIGDNEIIVRVIAFGQSELQAKTIADTIKNNVCNCLGEYVIGYNDDKLETTVLEFIKKLHFTVATVESCTGGMLASTLVGCSGISAYFNEGVITYSNEAKIKYAGVSPDTLKTFGAVSRQTAKEMAEGIKQKAGSDIGLSATGIAGPDGGSKEKPVGLVYIGMAIQNKTFVYELHLSGSRQAIREKTVKNILFELYKNLKQICT